MCRRCRGHCVFLHSYQNRVKQQQMLSPWLALVELVPSLRSVVVFILESMVGNKPNWQAWWKSPRGFSRAQRWAVIFIPEFHEVMGISEIWKRPNREINLLVFNRPTEKNNKKKQQHFINCCGCLFDYYKTNSHYFSTKLWLWLWQSPNQRKYSVLGLYSNI